MHMAPAGAARARQLAVGAALLLALAWPLLLYGRPAYFFDSVAYLNSGTRGVAMLLARLQGWLGGDGGVAAAATAAPGEGGSLRSLPYSLFIGLMASAGGQMLGAVLAQMAMLASVLGILLGRLAPGARARPLLLAGVVVALFTSLPWFAVFAMPDMLAGMLILVIGLLAVLPAGAGRYERLWLVALGSFAVAAHASHLLLGGVMVAAALAGLAWQGKKRGEEKRRVQRAAWVAAPLLAGAALTLAGAVTGVGEVSLAPRRLPFALTRAIEDGPAQRWLLANCGREPMVICKFVTKAPQRQADLLFGPEGLLRNATPAELDAIRAEEPVILRQVALAEPGALFTTAASNFAQQMLRFGLEEVRFDQRIIAGSDVRFALGPAPAIDLRRPFGWMIWLGVAGAALGLARLRSSLNATERGLLGLALVGLVANAGITGVLSAVADRYQSRVVWVLPVLALAFWLARSRRVDSDTATKVTLA